MSIVKSRHALPALVLLLGACAGTPPVPAPATTDAATPVASTPGANDATDTAHTATPAPKKSRAERKAEKTAATAAATGQGQPVSEALAQRNAAAMTLLEAQRYEEAAPILKEIVAGAPALTGPRINLAIALMQSGKLEEAQGVLEEAVTLAPENAAANTQLGIVYRMRGQFAPAERAYQAALAADPAYANAHYDLGVLYDLYLQRPADALAHYEQYQVLAGEDEQVKKWIADLTRRSGEGNGETKTAEVVEQ
jgi:tetratricopeptide (TPR) repeat protein